MKDGEALDLFAAPPAPIIDGVRVVPGEVKIINQPHAPVVDDATRAAFALNVAKVEGKVPPGVYHAKPGGQIKSPPIEVTYIDESGPAPARVAKAEAISHFGKSLDGKWFVRITFADGADGCVNFLNEAQAKALADLIEENKCNSNS